MGQIRKKERAKGVSYEAVVRIKGAPARSKSFDTEAEAKKWLAETEAKIYKGETVSAASIENTTLQIILQDYLDHHSKRDEETGEVIYTGITSKKAYNIKAIQFHLGMLTLKTLTHDAIEKFISKMLERDVPHPANRKIIHKLYDGAEVKKYSPATIRRYYFDLKTGVEWWAFKKHFELGKRFENHSVPAAWEPREQRINPDEEKKLVEACQFMLKSPEQWEQIIKLGLQTAMRASELIKLKVGSVHLHEDKRYLVVMSETNKMKELRSVPLSKKAVEILEANFESKKKRGVFKPETRVFDLLPIAEMSAGFKKISHRAGLKVVLSDTRHEALCRIIEQTSISIVEIALMSGQSIETLKTYVKRLRPAFMANKLDQIQ